VLIGPSRLGDVANPAIRPTAITSRIRAPRVGVLPAASFVVAAGSSWKGWIFDPPVVQFAARTIGTW
jgi:hypothetical protein